MTDVLSPTNGRTAEARLLVVDDEPNIVELLSASLRFAGFEVVTAMTGTDAVRAVERHRPDLVVLDVMLPDIDGFVVLRRLRTGSHPLPVVFLTARDANIVESNIPSRPRKLAGGGGPLIHTVRGIGYVLRPPWSGT